MKKQWIYIAGVLLIILLVFRWVSSHALLEISVANPTSGQVTYHIYNQGSKQTTDVTSSGSRIKRLVARGSYEIEDSQAQNSGFSIAKTGGFLSKKAVSLQNNAESSRIFVGDNPSQCENYISGRLISYACLSDFSTATIHVPATKDIPTYRAKFPPSLVGTSEGLISLKSGTIIALTPSLAENSGGHRLYVLKPDLTVASGQTLKDLDTSKLYTIKPYKDGFIAYDSGGAKVYYYSSAAAKPEIHDIAPADTARHVFASIDASADGGFAALYRTDRPSEAGTGDAVAKATPGTSIVRMVKNNQTTEFNFKKSYNEVRICGTDLLCLTDGTSLDVYAIAGNRTELKFTVSGVTDIENTPYGFVAVRKNGILRLDPVLQTGFLDYSFGGYGYEQHNIQSNGEGYIINVTNPEHTKVALYINQTKPNADSIDKKALELEKMSEISTVSISNQFIYIVPNGPIVYNSVTNVNGPDPKVQGPINQAISKKVSELGIDQKVYSVQITSPL